MPRQATPLVLSDLSTFARNLGRAWNARHAAASAPPGHVELQNLIARAAGYKNLQALKGAPPARRSVREPLPLSDHARRTPMQFDADGRLVRWPAKYTTQRMAMWVLWTRFDGKRPYTEREVNTILRAAHAFGDHATLRRELVNHRLLARKSDCSEYRKLPARPDDEVRVLLTAWRARSPMGAEGETPPAASAAGGDQRAATRSGASRAVVPAPASADAMMPPPRHTSPS